MNRIFSSAAFFSVLLGSFILLAGQLPATPSVTSVQTFFRSIPRSSSPAGFTHAGPLTYFNADDGRHGKQLWATDGTYEGTLLVKEIFGQGGSNPSNMTELNGMLLFSAMDARYGTELWRTDGTAAGTVLVKDIVPGKRGSYPGSLQKAGLWPTPGSQRITFFPGQ